VPDCGANSGHMAAAAPLLTRTACAPARARVIPGELNCPLPIWVRSTSVPHMASDLPRPVEEGATGDEPCGRDATPAQATACRIPTGSGAWHRLRGEPGSPGEQHPPL